MKFKRQVLWAACCTALLAGNVAKADIIHADDVIAQFSMCIGNDCVNGENFGFDTLRLKENNLRIHFNDTSTSASFPSNDWRIIANDSSNGGGNYMAIEDSTAGRQVFRVDAGAPANSLRIDSAGDVGVGEDNPVVEVHVTDGDSPTLRLEQDGSSGFTPQTWDLASNEANFFIRDVTNGSQLPFRIKPGADSDSLFIAANNNVGIGTDSPGAAAHIRSGGTAVAASAFSSLADLIVQDSAATGDIAMLSLVGGATSNVQLTFGNPANVFEGQIIFNNNTDEMNFNVGGAQRFSINLDGSIDSSTGASLTAGGTWTDASSRELKSNIVEIPLKSAIETVMALNPVSFNYKSNPAEDRLGFIAEDVPTTVAYNDKKRLSSMDIVAALTKVVQQQQEAISELKKTLEEMADK